MGAEHIRVLMIEDDTDFVYLITESIRQKSPIDIDIDVEHSLSAGLKRLESGGYEVVLLDLHLPDSGGIETLHTVINAAPDMPIVVLSGGGDDTTALEVVKQGAQDYLFKEDADGLFIGRVLRYAIERKRMTQDFVRSNLLITTLNLVSAQMDTFRDPDLVLETLGNGLKGLGIDTVVAMTDPGNQSLTIRYTSLDSRLMSIGESMLGASLLGYRIAFGSNSSLGLKTVIEEKQPLFVWNLFDPPGTIIPGTRRAEVEQALELAGISLDIPIVYLPLINDEQVIGVLGLWGDLLQERDVPALTVFSSQVAATYMNMRLQDSLEQELAERRAAEKTLKRRVDELAALQATVLEIITPHELSGLLQTIVERAARLMNAKSGGLYLCDPEKEEVRCVVSYNTQKDYTGVSLKYGEGAAGLVAQTGQALIIDDYRNWEGKAGVFENDQPFEALVSAPMLWQGQVTGVLHMLRSVEQKPFSQADLDVLHLLANHAAIAVANAQQLDRLQAELKEHKRTEEALLASEESLREAQRIAKIGSWRWNFDEGRFNWSRELYRIFGQDPETFTPSIENVVDLIHPDDRDISMAAIGQALQSSEPISVDFRVITQEQGIKWMHSQGEVILDKDGNPLYARGATQDITGRKLADEELRTSTERFNQLSENIEEGFWITNEDSSEIVYLSPAISKIWGRPLDEFFNNPETLTTSIFPEDRQRVLDARADRIQGDKTEIVYRIVRSDGSVRWIWDRSFTIRDTKNDTLRRAGIVSDITEKKNAEESIRRRDRILSVTTFAAARFLKSSNWRNAIGEALEQLGKGTKVARVYIFENHTDPDGNLLTSQRFEWADESTPPQIDNPDLQNLPWLESGFSRWMENLANDLAIHGPIDTFPESEREILEAQSIRSLLVMPIFVEGKWWGFIGFDDCLTERIWLPQEVDALRTAASTLGAAIQSELAEKALERRTIELQTLYKTSLEINAQKELDSLLQVIVESAASLVGVESGGLYLLDNGGEFLNLVVSYNLPEQYVGTRIKLGEGLSGKVAQTGKAFVVENYQEWKARIKVFGNTQIRRALGVPLKIKGKVTGVINVLDRNRVGVFSEEEYRLVSLFADQAAIAIENARLFADAQRRLRQTSALREIDQVIAGSVYLQHMLEIVLKHSIIELGVDAAVVLLYDPRDQMLKYELGRGFYTDALKYTHLRIGEGYAGQAASTRKIVHVSDLRSRTTDFLRSPTFHQEGFINYFGVPLIAKDEIKGVLEVFHRSPFNADRDWLAFVETLAGQVAIGIDNATLYRDLQRSNVELSQAYDATIEGWSRALDLRDKETEGHTRRVTELTMRMALEMGIPENDLVHIQRGALLHDIGKMGIPDRILFKPASLTDEEWELMQRHPTFAYEMLKPISYLEPALDIPYCHHEKWDGTGYPRGLAGEEIPLSARIFAVIDVFDALTSDRPYRPAWSKEKTLSYILEQEGKHFDPKVVEVFLRILNEEKE